MLETLVGGEITLKIAGLRVKGKLVAFSESNRREALGATGFWEVIFFEET